ncbi:MAG: copper transporter [Sciscionella sp.]
MEKPVWNPPPSRNRTAESRGTRSRSSTAKATRQGDQPGSRPAHRGGSLGPVAVAGQLSNRTVTVNSTDDVKPADRNLVEQLITSSGGKVTAGQPEVYVATEPVGYYCGCMPRPVSSCGGALDAVVTSRWASAGVRLCRAAVSAVTPVRKASPCRCARSLGAVGYDEIP